MKAEKNFGENFFWVLGGIPTPESNSNFEYYIIPSSVMAKHISEGHLHWLNTPGIKGQAHNKTKIRTINLPPLRSILGWDISEYRERWDLIEQKLIP